MLCVCVRTQRVDTFRVSAFFNLIVQNGVNDHILSTATVFKERMKERTHTGKEKKQTGRRLGRGEKKELCPVADTQTGWFG